MSTENTDSPRQAHLESVLADYLVRIDRGEAVDRDAWLGDHADLADDLRSYLDAAHDVDTLARRAFEPTGPPGVDGSSSRELIRYFGDYEVLSEVARGGMGVVYRARQVSLNRIVAVKTILAGRLAGEDDVRRFISEAEAAASLRHANIAAIYEIGEHDGRRYYSMEFVEGTSLADLAREGPSPPKQAARYVRLVSEAIGYAHAMGILHRDLKPSNILIDRDDQPRVTDFGLAKRVAVDKGLTATGQILGTPSYMPPEQASADRGKVSEASDVYSLGAILYELLCGRPPFRASSPMETILQVLETTPASPRLINPTVPSELETIALKCLEKDPARRFLSAQALADDLGRWLEGKPILARPTGSIERLSKWVRRRPAVAALLAMVAVTSSIGLAAFGFQYAQTDQERRRVVLALHDAREAAEREKQSRAEAERNLYVSQVALAQNDWERNDLEQARAALGAVPPGPGHWEWHYLHRIAQPPRGIPLYGTMAYRPFHENEVAGLVTIRRENRGTDGKVNGYGEGPAVGIVDRRTGVARLTLPEDPDLRIWQSPTRRLAFSRDGRALLTAHSRNNDSEKRPALIAMWNADTGARILELPRAQTPGEVHALAFHPDGTRFATSHYEWGVANGAPTVRLWDAASGKLLRTLESTWTTLLKFHPRKPWLASQQKIWNIETGDGLRDFPAPSGGSCTFLAWSPDGALMAVAPTAAPTLIDVCETETGKLQHVLHGHTQPVAPTAVAFSPDGKWLASGTDVNNRKGEVKVWDVASGTELRSYRGARSRVDALAFHPSEPEFAVVAFPDTLFLDPRRAQDATVIPLPQQREWEDGFAWFTGDSRRVITSNGDGSRERPPAMVEPMALTARDASTGEALWTTHMEKGPLALAPDGSQLAFIAEDGVRVIDAATGKIVRVLPEMKARRLEGPGRPTKLSSARVSMLAFDPSGNYLAGRTITPESTASTVVWDARSGNVQAPPDGWGINFDAAYEIDSAYILLPAGERQGSGWGSYAQVPDQSRSRSARADGRDIIVRDAGASHAGRRFGPFAGKVEGLAFSRDGTQIVGQSRDEIRVWDVATGRTLPEPRGIEPFTGLAFGSMGERLVISGENEPLAIVRDDSTGLYTSVRYRYGNGRHFDPQLRWGVILDAGGHPVTVLDLATGHEKMVAASTTSMMSCAFFPDGRRLATGDADGTVRLWDTQTWTAVLTLQAHGRGVTNLAVSPDGHRIATIGWDGTLKIWDGTP